MNRIAIFVSFAVIVFTASASAAERISNGSFEQTTNESWFPKVIALATNERTSLFSKDGGYSYVVSNMDNANNTPYFQSRTNSISAATGHRFSTWLLRKNMGSGGNMAGDIIFYWRNGGSAAGSTTVALPALLDGVWTNFTSIVTTPSGIDSFYITAELKQNPANRGKMLYFDKISLVDGIPPVISTLSPANNAIAITAGANLILTFNVTVQKGSGYIYIRKFMDDSIVQTIDINDLTPGVISGSGSTSITINPPSDLALNTQYYIMIDSGAIKDNQAVPVDFPGITTKNTWTFVTADTVAPTVTAVNPTNGSVGIMPSRNLVLTFDESVKKGAGDIEIRRSIDDVALLTVGVGTTQVTVSNNIVTINPINDMPETNVYLNIPSGAVLDLTGVAYAGITSNIGWQFQVLDAVAPVSTSIVPANGAYGVLPASTLQLVFTENVRAGSGSIYIKDYYTDSVVQTIAANSASVTYLNNVVTITPPVALTADKQYYITIDANAIMDYAANVNYYAGINTKTSWTFLTTGAIAPAIAALSPADDSAGVSSTANFIIAFDKNICMYPGDPAGSVNRYFYIYTNGILYQSNATDSGLITVQSNLALIDFPGNLPDGPANIRIGAGALSNLSQIAYGGILDNTTWNFTVTDTTPPSIQILTPPNSSSGFNVTANLDITFDEIVVKGTGNIYIKKYSDDSTVQTIDITTAAVTLPAGSRVVTINPASDLTPGVRYYITVDAGAIKDDAAAQNAFGGISSKTVWSFVAADVTAPTATAFYPLDGQSSVVPSTPLMISFSEDIMKGAGNILIKRSNDNVLLMAIDVQSTNVLVASNVVYITHPLTIPDTNVYVNIAAGVIQDLSANNYAGIADATTWDFNIVDTFAPVVSAYTPTNGTLGFPVNDFLRLTFDENVQKGTGNIVIRNYANDAAVQTIDVTTASVAVANNRLTITPPSTLQTNMKYYVTVDAGAIKDVANTPNNYGGISAKTVWSFQTFDTINPAVSALSPTNGDGAAGASSNLIMTFAEPIKWTGNSDTITIKRFSDNVTLHTFTNNDPAVVIAGSVVSIDPPADLPKVKLYVLIGPTMFSDLSDNPYDGITANSTWQFTVGDAVAPNRGAPHNTITRRTDASVRFNNLTAGDEVWIYSATGYKLATVPYGGATANWTIPANLSSGVYIVKIMNGTTAVSSYKIVLLR